MSIIQYSSITGSEMRVKNEIFTACITNVFTPTFLTQLKNRKMESELFSSVENTTRNLTKTKKTLIRPVSKAPRYIQFALTSIHERHISLLRHISKFPVFFLVRLVS